MVSPVLVVVCVSIIIYALFRRAFNKPPNFPPGPWSIPILGAYSYLLWKNYKAPHKYLATLMKKYDTNILGFDVGAFPTIVVGDSDSIREVLFRKEFDGRMDPYVARLRSFGKRLGIFFNDGDIWLQQRRFTLRYMRDFGFGRRMQSLEDVIENESREIIKLIEDGPQTKHDEVVAQKGRIVLVPDLFYVGFMNAYTTVLTDTQLPPEMKPKLRQTCLKALQFQRAADAMGGIISIIPWIRKIAPNWSRYNDIVEGHQGLIDLSQELIATRKENLSDETNHGFVDIYLKEMAIQNSEGDTSYYSDDQLIVQCADFMLPSASAVSATLAFAVEYLMLYPDIQEKVYQEIGSVVGFGRLPTLDDRVNLPFCEATLREVMRCETLTPLGVPHRAVEDTTLNGYHIPKDTMILTNLWELHNSKELWGDPENFRPERFIAADGKLTKKDMTIPFGLGRRVCAGETFARNTMFLFMTSLYQNYRIVPVPGHPLPDISKRRSGLIINVEEFWVQCIPRNP